MDQAALTACLIPKAEPPALRKQIPDTSNNQSGMRTDEPFRKEQMVQFSSKQTVFLHTLAVCIVFFLISVISCGLASAKSNSVRNHPRISAVNAGSTTVNLRDFGAVGDGSADDSPALQLALDALEQSGGGTLQVPSGFYVLRTPVLKQFTSGLELSIEGEPSTTPIQVAGNGKGLNLTSVFIIAAGDANDAIILDGLASLHMKDIAFNGVPETLTDARVVLGLANITTATIQHCEFYGLASLVAGGAIVAAVHTDLRLQQTAFLGCAASSGLSTSVVQTASWLGISVVDCKFIDYGLREDFFSKTPLSVPLAWVMIGNAADPEPGSSRREAVLNNVFLDEGAFMAVAVLPEFFGGKAPHYLEVYLTKLNVNVSNLGTNAIEIRGARKVFIERSQLGWSHNADHAIYLTDVGEAVLDLVDCSDDATRIFANVDRLTVMNSTYTSLESTGPVTQTFTTATTAEDPAQYVTEQYLAAMNREPDAVGHFYWTTRILHCETDETCMGEARSALANYLAATPPARFSLQGQVRDENGTPIAAAAVRLTNSHSVVTVTDGNGNFEFSNLPTAGEYQLVVTKNHYSFESKELITPVSDQVINIGGVLLRHSIRGRVVDEHGSGVAGAVLDISGPNVLSIATAADGSFKFDSLPAGFDYTLSVSRENYTFSDATFEFADLSADQNQVITGTVVKYTIAGTVSKDGAALADVVVNLSGGTNASGLTDQKGKYSFVVDAENAYIITPQKSGYVFEPTSQSVDNLSDNEVVNFTPKLRPALVSGIDPTRALAFDTVLRTTEPFALSYDYQWSGDTRTRLTLFALNVQLSPGDRPKDLTVELEDASHRIYPLTVEYLDTVPEAPEVVRIVVRLSDDLTDVGDVLVRMKYQNISSDSLHLAIGHLSN